MIKIFKSLDIRVDQRFAVGVVCYVLFGSSLRVLGGACIFAPPLQYLFITPIAYFLVFFVALAALLLSIKIYGKEYHTMFSAIGLGLASVNIALLLWYVEIVHPKEALLIVAITAVSTAFIYLCAVFAKIGFLRDRFNIAIIGAQIFDTTSIMVATNFLGYGGGQTHPLKLLAIIAVLYLVDNKIDGAELRDMLKLAILVLGLSPACRNTIRILFGV